MEEDNSAMAYLSPESFAAQSVANLLRQSSTPSVFGIARNPSGTVEPNSNTSGRDQRPLLVPLRWVRSARSHKRMRTTEYDNSSPSPTVHSQHDRDSSPATTETPAFSTFFARAAKREETAALEVRSPQLGAFANFWVHLGSERATLPAPPSITDTAQEPQTRVPNSNSDNDDASLPTLEAELPGENAGLQNVMKECLQDVEQLCNLSSGKQATTEENQDQRLLNIEIKLPLCDDANSRSLRPKQKAPSLEHILVTKNVTDDEVTINITLPTQSDQPLTISTTIIAVPRIEKRRRRFSEPPSIAGHDFDENFPPATQ